MTSENEIDVVAASGNDSIYVTQSGGMLTITANGTSQNVAAYGELVIWGGNVNDTITVDNSVTLDTSPLWRHGQRYADRPHAGTGDDCFHRGRHGYAYGQRRQHQLLG